MTEAHGMGRCRRSLLVTGLLVLSSLFAESPLHAWEIKTTNSGVPVRWGVGEIPISLELTSDVDGVERAAAEEAALSAFESWRLVAPEHLNLSYQVEDADAATGRDGRNSVRWGVKEEDAFVDPEALATTYLSYRTSTGQVVEGDIVVNAVNHQWAVLHQQECSQRYDLENILAHEAGHFFGLSHSPDTHDSTMYPSAGQCETNKRGLHDDDKAGLMYLYENLSVSRPTGEPQEFVNCSTGGGSGLFAALVVLLLLYRRRRREENENSPDWAAATMTRKRARRSLQHHKSPHKISRWMVWFGGIVFLLSGRESSASTLVNLSGGELQRHAEIVARGKVLRKNVVLESGLPVTISELQVSYCDKEDCPATLQIRQWGGEVGEFGLKVSGVKALQLGQEVVVFLREQGSFAKRQGEENLQGQGQGTQSYALVGRSQGLFVVQNFPGGQILWRDTRGNHFLQEKSASFSESYSGRLEGIGGSEFHTLFGSKLLKKLQLFSE